MDEQMNKLMNVLFDWMKSINSRIIDGQITVENLNIHGWKWTQG